MLRRNAAGSEGRVVLSERRKQGDGEWKEVRSFEVLNKLGKGGFAKVYLARDRKTLEQFAVKVLAKSSL